MHCSDWAADNITFDHVGSLQSQRISEIFNSIQERDQLNFYKSWASKICENDYLALDIKSIYSYSKLNIECEYGNNRDKEKLSQINLCLLFGQNTFLPVYQTIYSGSLNDVTTLNYTIKQFENIIGDKKFTYIMDKGFFSIDNIITLLYKRDHRFLISLPFKLKIAKQLVKDEKINIEHIDNTILTSIHNKPIRGVHRIINYGKENIPLNTFIFFNYHKYISDRDKIYADIQCARRLIESNEDYSEYLDLVSNYINIQKTKGCKPKIFTIVKDSIINNDLETTGWFVLISNYITDKQEAHDIYRNKDVVEKAFYKYKKVFGLNRLYAHKDKRMIAKTFTAFIALIINSYITNKIKSVKSLNNYNIDNIINAMTKIKCFINDDEVVIRKLTVEQKEIFEKFEIKLPENNKNWDKYDFKN
jgi:transposase